MTFVDSRHEPSSCFRDRNVSPPSCRTGNGPGISRERFHERPILIHQPLSPPTCLALGTDRETPPGSKRPRRFATSARSIVPGVRRVNAGSDRPRRSRRCGIGSSGRTSERISLGVAGDVPRARSSMAGEVSVAEHPYDRASMRYLVSKTTASPSRDLSFLLTDGLEQLQDRRRAGIGMEAEAAATDQRLRSRRNSAFPERPSGNPSRRCHALPRQRDGENHRERRRPHHPKEEWSGGPLRLFVPRFSTRAVRVSIATRRHNIPLLGLSAPKTRCARPSTRSARNTSIRRGGRRSLTRRDLEGQPGARLGDFILCWTSEEHQQARDSSYTTPSRSRRARVRDRGGTGPAADRVPGSGTPSRRREHRRAEHGFGPGAREARDAAPGGTLRRERISQRRNGRAERVYAILAREWQEAT